jgi:hypothetical protein
MRSSPNSASRQVQLIHTNTPTNILLPSQRPKKNLSIFPHINTKRTLSQSEHPLKISQKKTSQEKRGLQRWQAKDETPERTPRCFVTKRKRRATDPVSDQRHACYAHLLQNKRSRTKDIAAKTTLEK